MRYITAFLRFWYNFIVGDDWTIAASVGIAIALTFLLVQWNVQGWWMLPVVAIVSLGVSLWRATRTQ
jgi:hypothetical protein